MWKSKILKGEILGYLYIAQKGKYLVIQDEKLCKT
jgi:hypothetical protein